MASSYPPPTNMYEVGCLHEKIEQHLSVVVPLSQRIVRETRYKEELQSQTLSTFADQIQELGVYLKDLELHPKITMDEYVFSQLCKDIHSTEITWANFGRVSYNLSRNHTPVHEYRNIWYVCSNKGPFDYKAARDMEKYVMTAVEEFDDLLARIIEIKEGRVEEIEKFSMARYLQEENAYAPQDAIQFWTQNFTDECNEVDFTRFRDVLFTFCDQQRVQLDERYGPNKCFEALTDCFVNGPEDNEVDNVEFMLFVQNQSSLAQCLESLVTHFYAKQKPSPYPEQQRGFDPSSASAVAYPPAGGTNFASPYPPAQNTLYAPPTLPNPSYAPLIQPESNDASRGVAGLPYGMAPPPQNGYGVAQPFSNPGYGTPAQAGYGSAAVPPPQQNLGYGMPPMSQNPGYGVPPVSQNPGYGVPPVYTDNQRTGGPPPGYGGYQGSYPEVYPGPPPEQKPASSPAGYPTASPGTATGAYNPTQNYGVPGSPSNKPGKIGSTTSGKPPAGYPGSTSSYSSKPPKTNSTYPAQYATKPPKHSSSYEYEKKQKKKRKKKQKKVAKVAGGLAVAGIAAAIIF